MLCTKLPTIENGLAVPEDLPDGTRGIAVTYTLRPDARWGDGTPVSTADVVFTWEVGRHPRSGIANSERSEEHTSELQSLMRISYAVFCLKKKKESIYSKRTQK